jgi:hypothetical protein
VLGACARRRSNVISQYRRDMRAVSYCRCSLLAMRPAAQLRTVWGAHRPGGAARPAQMQMLSNEAKWELRHAKHREQHQP